MAEQEVQENKSAVDDRQILDDLTLLQQVDGSRLGGVIHETSTVELERPDDTLGYVQTEYRGTEDLMIGGGAQTGSVAGGSTAVAADEATTAQLLDGDLFRSDGTRGSGTGGPDGSGLFGEEGREAAGPDTNPVDVLWSARTTTVYNELDALSGDADAQAAASQSTGAAPLADTPAPATVPGEAAPAAVPADAVTVAPAVSEAPTLTVGGVTGDEDTAIALNILAALTDAGEVLTVTLSGIPAGAVLRDGSGATLAVIDGAIVLTAAQLAGLTVTPPANSGESFTLTVTATSTDGTAAPATVTATLPVTVNPVSDTPTLAVQAAGGNEDTAIALTIDPALTDTDGSETLTITISGIPAGAVLSNAAGETLTIVNGSITLTPGQLAGLAITPPLNSDADFTLTVTATSTDGSAAPASTSAPLVVSVAPVSDTPTLATQAASGNEDSAIPLSIDPALTDTDGSETLTITLSGIPQGAVLSNAGGVLTVVDGSITLTPDQLAGLAITPPANSDADFTLTVTATSTDGTAAPASVTSTLPVTVNPVSDMPTLSVQAAGGDEDTAIALTIAPALTDTDGSETLTITISGIPDGASLRNGAGDTLTIVNGSITLTPGQLAGLAITPPANSDVDFTLTVTATAKDGVAEAVSTSAPLLVTVNPVSDTPVLTAPDVVGDEDTPIPLAISAVQPDADGSEVLSFTISGIPAGAVLTNTAGDTLTIVNGAVTLTPDQIAGLAITPPHDSDADFTLTVTATSKDGDAAPASTSAPLLVTVNPVSDAPTLSVQDATGAENTAIALTIDPALTDIDGSEVLTVTIGGIPSGASLHNGAGDTLTISNGSITLTPEQLAGLTITPPWNSDDDFILTVTATSKDGVAEVANTIAPLLVTVTPVTDTPTLSVTAASGDEDTAIALTINPALTDTDGSETLTITISGIPAGASLSNTAGNTLTIVNGSITLTPEQLAGLKITPPDDSDADFTLTVTATAKDGVAAPVSVSEQLSVTVNPVTDTPTLSVTAASGDEDTAIALTIDPALTDTDGSETLTITISGIPNGASLGNTAGALTIVNGTITLTPDQLAGLKITPPDDSDADFNLTVTATAKDGVADPVSVSQTLAVTVNPVSDTPTLTVQAASGDEDTAIALVINPALTDTDGSETLSVRIGNIPGGATLTNTAGDTLTISNGSITLTPEQLAGLKITPPVNSDVDFTLTVTAVAKDGSAVEATKSEPLLVVVNPVSDTPTLTVQAASGDEDTAIALVINPALTDTDGSETLSVRIGNIPGGATLTNTAGDTLTISNGTITLTPEQLAGLKITPPDDSDADFTLMVTAVAKDGSAVEATRSEPLVVTVNPVSDTPTLSVTAASGDEDTAIALVINPALTDTDGSETLSIRIGNIPGGATLTNTAGDTLTIVNGTITLTPDQLAGLKITPPDDSDVDFTLTVTAVAKDGSAVEATRSEPLVVTVNPVSDMPTLSVSAASGDEDTAIALVINPALTDTDGSETLSIRIGDIPGGATLTNTAGDTLTIVNGTITLTPEQLAGLKITPPDDSDADFTLTVTAVAKDGSAVEATRSEPLVVTVNPVSDTPTLTVQAASGDEDTAIALAINPALTDTDGSETLSIRISNIPGGATLTNTAGDTLTISNGTITLTPEQLAGLKITPPDDSDVDFTLTVTAVAKDGSAVEATRSEPLVVTVNPVSDTPTLSVTAASGDEDTAIALVINPALTDTDGSETLSIRIGNIPGGATLTNTAGDTLTISNGTITLTPEQLAGLKITPPVNSDVDFTLTVTAVAKDGSAVEATRSEPLVVTVNPVSDTPTLTVQAASGDEDTAIALVINPALTDTDGSETLSIRIGNIPGGATLTNTAGDTLTISNGTITLTPEQLAGLKITPPDDSDIDFTLTVTAVAKDGSAVEATKSEPLLVVVNPVSDTPTLSVTAASGDEDTAIALVINPALTDTDGSETLSIRIGNIPGGATLTNTAGDTLTIVNGTITLTPDQLAGLKITPPDDSDVDFTLTVTAVAKDGSAVEATRSEPLVVTVNPVSDMPTLSVSAASGDEDTAIALVINPALTDTDGSETLSVRISNIPGGATLTNTAGDTLTIVNGTITLTPDQLAGLKITPPDDSDVDFTLTVTAVAKDGSAVEATKSEPLLVVVNPVTDTPTLTVSPARGDEDTAIALDIASALTDTDGSETLTITISGIPPDATLSNTAGALTIVNGSVTLTAGQLAGLKITPPDDSDADFTLTVTATAKDGVADAVSVNRTLAVTVNPVSDTPTLTVQGARGDEDTAIALVINPALTDTDGSETLSIRIGDIPGGATLTNTAGDTLTIVNGTITLTPDQLAGLKITPPDDSDVDFTLTVTAVAKDGSAVEATKSEPLLVVVNPVTDTPTLTVSPASGDEDTAIALDIASALTDTDGSETLTITISGIPSDATLTNTAGALTITNGSITLTPGQLAGLKITPRRDSDVDFTLTVTATAKDGVAAAVNVQKTLAVTVIAVADAPTAVVTPITYNLNNGQNNTLTGTAGNDTLQGGAGHDTIYGGAGDDVIYGDGTGVFTVNLSVGATLSDTDGSESISRLVISGVPAGASLSAGTYVTETDGTTTWTLTPAQLSGLKLTANEGDSTHPITLTVTATSVEQENGSTATSTPKTLSVTFTGTPQGNDSLEGGDGDDTIYGGAGKDTLRGGAGNDSLDGGTGDDLLAGGLGDDTIDGGAGTDTVTYADSATAVNANLATGIGSGEGNDVLRNLENVTGSAFDDVITGSSGANVLIGGAGNDTISGGGGTDTIRGGAGDDLSIFVVGEGGTTAAPELQDGDTGIDTFRVMLTGAQLRDPAILADLRTLRDSIEAAAAKPNAANADTSTDNAITLTALKLRVVDFEKLEIYVDGQPVIVREVLNYDPNPPTATAANTPGTEDRVVNGQLAAVDPDIANGRTDDTLTYQGPGTNGQPVRLTHGTVVVNGDGSFTYTPDPDFSGTDSFTFTVTDSYGGSSTATQTITVAPVADAFQIGTLNARGNEDQAGGIALSPTITLSDVDVASPEAVENVTLLIPASQQDAGGAKLYLNGVELTRGGPDAAGNYSWTIPTSALAAVGGTAGAWSVQGLTVTTAHNSDADLNYTLKVGTVDGSGATASRLVQTATGTITVDAVADAPTLRANAATTKEDISVALSITPALTDTDGSESISAITISNVPDGASLSAGTHVTEADGTTTWTLTRAQLAGLRITPPHDFSGTITLSVTATSEERENGSTAVSAPATLSITVTGVADAPIVGVNPVSGNEDTAIALGVTAALSDLTGETLDHVTITGVPEGATLSAGTHNADGSWTLTPAELNGLTFTPPHNYSGSVTLTVTATSVEGTTTATSTPLSFAVTVKAVADTPLLSAASAVGREDTAIPLSVTAALTDRDGSETLTIIVGGVPADASLNHGTRNADGTWTLTSNDLAGLTITPPSNSNAGFDLTFTARATESSNGSTADAAPVTVHVEVQGVADVATPTGALSARGAEDTAINLQLGNLQLTDDDGSERLSLVVSNLPDGASLSLAAGHEGGLVYLGNGRWSVDVEYRNELTLTTKADFAGTINLKVDVITTDSNGAATIVVNGVTSGGVLKQTRDLTVTVDPKADEPIVSISASAPEDNPGGIPLVISALTGDSDGSEHISAIVISGLPAGVTITSTIAGALTDNGDGTWSVDPAKLGGLRLHVPEHDADDFPITVSVTATDGSDSLTRTYTPTVVVTAVADAPMSKAADNTLVAYHVDDQVSTTGVPTDMVLDLNAHLQDTDGSESLAVIIEGVPKGARLSFGIDNGDGTWTLSPADYAAALTAGGVKLTVLNANASGISHTTVTTNGQTYDQGSLTLTVRPFSIEREGDRNTSVSDSFVVSWSVPQGSTGGGNNGGGNNGGGDTGGGNNGGGNDGGNNGGNNGGGNNGGGNNGGGTQQLTAIATGEDTAVALGLDGSLPDLQNAASVKLTGIPADAELKDAQGVVIAVQADGSVTLTPSQLAGLTLTPPPNSDADFSLGIVVTNGDSTQKSLSLPVTVTAVADAPSLTVHTATGNEDTAIALDITAALTDRDGSESLVGIVIDNVPAGAKLSAGFEDSTNPGRWVLTPAELAGLKFTPPADASGSIQLSVTAVSRESSNADRATTTTTLTVEVAPVSDAPTINVTAPSAKEDEAAHLSIDVAVTDLVGTPEVISAVRLTVPTGFTLSAGTALGGGVYDLSGLTPAERAALTLAPPPNYAGTVTLTVDAASKDGTADQAWSSKSFTVTFAAVADAPDVTVHDTTGNEDTAIALDLSAALTDTDGSESIAIILSGLPDGAVLNQGSNNGDGSWTLKPADLTGLKVIPPRNMSGGMDLTLTATSLESSNKNTASTSRTFHVEVAPVADAPAISVASASGSEDTPIALNLSAALVDRDGSETLSVVLSGLPSGTKLVTADGDTLIPTGGAVTLTAAQLSGLKLLPPANSGTDFNLTLTATATERATGATATSSQLFRVSVDPVADEPIVTWTPLTGTEDTDIPLNLAVALADTDGSERLGLVTITGVPAGATLSDGTRNADGSWTLTPDQLAGLTLTPPTDSDVDITLTITALSHESNGTTATTVVTLPITMNAVSDTPTLSVQAASGAEDTAIALTINPAQTDADGSETLTVTISGIPGGASLSNDDGDTLVISGGSITLTPGQLAGLRITPPDDSDADFVLTVTARSKDGSAAEATTSQTLSVTVTPVTDTPTLSVTAASGDEDTAIALAIDPALTDTDGSETLTVTISGIPGGASLSNDGGDTLTIVGGSITLTPGQLAGLKITPPDDSDADFTLTVTATARDGSAAPVTVTDTLTVTVNPVSDAPTLTVQPATGNEDSPIALNITSALTDTDGSETLTITLSGIPDDAVLANAGGVLTVVNGTVTLTPAQLNGLKITPPDDSSDDFTLTVTATAKDGTAAGADTVRTLAVTVNPVSDTPTLIVQPASGAEDTAIALTINPAQTDADGSETLTVTISGIPGGASLSNDDGDALTIVNGSITLTLGQLAGLKITPPDDSSDDFTLTVTARSKDGSAAEATTSQPLSVTVTPVTDRPTLSVTAASGDEDTAIALTINPALTDTDGSETLTVTLSGIPDGATLRNSAGALTVVAGAITLTPSQLTGLKITPPVNSGDDFTLTVTATARDGSAAPVSVADTLTVTVNPVANTPALTVAATHGPEDTAIALSITAASTDIDGSETVTVRIDGVPDGASLNHGTHNADGSWSLTAAQLAGLTYTPPSDANGTVNLTVTVTAHDGASTATASQTLAVTVDPVNDAPTLSGAAPTLSGAEGATVFAASAADHPAVAADATIADVDSTTMSSMTIRIASGSQSGDTLNLDSLSIATDPDSGRKTVGGTGIEVTWDDANHQLSLTGNASTATYTDILHHLALTPGGTGARTLEVTVTDQEGATSDPLAVQVMVSGDGAMSGTAGNDTLHGGAGTTSMAGGAGDDLFIFAPLGGNLTIDGGAGGSWTDVVHMGNFAGGVENWMDQIEGEYTLDPSGHALTFNHEWSGTLTDQNGHELVLQNIERLTF